MRRKEYLVDDPSVLDAFLQARTWGTLSVIDEEGLPYGVPMSYAWRGGRFIFHGARAGRKAGPLGRGGACSFSVVEALSFIPSDWKGSAEACEATQFFRSVHAWGPVRLVEDEAEKAGLLADLTLAFEPGVAPAALAFPTGMLKATAVWVLEPVQLTGKFKLGQNWSDADIATLVAFLEQRGAPEDPLTVSLIRRG